MERADRSGRAFAIYFASSANVIVVADVRKSRFDSVFHSTNRTPISRVRLTTRLCAEKMLGNVSDKGPEILKTVFLRGMDFAASPNCLPNSVAFAIILLSLQYAVAPYEMLAVNTVVN